MPKLTTEQIIAVDKALWDIGIKFLDIRIEMTDHAAAAIEEMDGTFNRNLKKYIFENKAELQKNYSQFRMNASVKALKLLLRNMFTFRFIAILATVYALVFAEYNYEGPEETSIVFLMVSMFGIVGAYIYVGYIKFIKSYRLFSTAERLMAIVGSLGFTLCIPLRVMVENDAVNDEVILLYYAFVISIYVQTMLTYRFLNIFYKSRYILN